MANGSAINAVGDVYTRIALKSIANEVLALKRTSSTVVRNNTPVDYVTQAQLDALQTALQAQIDAVQGGIRPLTQDFTTVNSVGLSNTTLHTYTIPANGLLNDGDSISFDYAGTMLATTNDFQLTLGGTVLFDTGAIVPGSTTPWRISGRLIRTGSATQKLVLHQSYINSEGEFYGTGSKDLTTSLALALKVATTSSADVTKETAILDYREAA